MARKLNDTTRQHIVDTAGQAFYTEGYQAIGVDALAERTGVSKMTLYRHFPSKDELIVAVIDQFNANASAHYQMLMAPHATPRAKLLAVFEWIADRAHAPACAGCAFQNSVAEFPDHDAPVHKAALANKITTHAAYLEQAQALGAADPRQLADQLLLLTDGAWAAARMWGPDNPARSLVAAAAALIDAACAGKTDPA
jgi:AcrR family transcriptional regulator